MTKPISPTPATVSLERRATRCGPGVEVRLVDRAEGQLPTIVGYAAVFDSLSEDLGGFRERIKPGAFDTALASGRVPLDVRALVDHLPYRIIGRSTAGTLRLSIDSRGLRVEIDPPNNSIGLDTVESIRRGDIAEMSFGFICLKESVLQDGDQVIRELLDCDLYDVSVVTFPAYPDTTVALRSLAAARTDPTPKPITASQLDADRRKRRLALASVEF
jgi:uncharacterized protein